MSEFHGQMWTPGDAETRANGTVEVADQRITVRIAGSVVADWDRSHVRVVALPRGYRLSVRDEVLEFVPTDTGFAEAIGVHLPSLSQRIEVAAGEAASDMQPSPAAKSSRSTGKVLKKLGIAAGGFLAFVLVLGMVADIADGPDPDTADSDGVWEVCRKFMREDLVAPSTARFPQLSDVEVGPLVGRPAVWQAVGYVDAENGFGAMLRLNFVCQVEYLGDDRYLLVRLSEI